MPRQDGGSRAADRGGLPNLLGQISGRDRALTPLSLSLADILVLPRFEIAAVNILHGLS